jgi:hypothetical protein
MTNSLPAENGSSAAQIAGKKGAEAARISRALRNAQRGKPLEICTEWEAIDRLRWEYGARLVKLGMHRDCGVYIDYVRNREATRLYGLFVAPHDAEVRRCL